MDKNALFEKNIFALSKSDQQLQARLLKTEIKNRHYTFLASRLGEKVPAIIDSSGIERPLHSTFDPKKEAKRLIDSEEGGGFIIFLGLGAPYYAEAALQRNDVSMALVIDYNISGIAELFNHLDYSVLFSNPRFKLLLDAGETELSDTLLNSYNPVLSGGIRVIPLRPRTAVDNQSFALAAKTITSVIDKISSDYSVQAHFGKRWFGNITRNLKNIDRAEPELPSVKKAAVTAAGPSLLAQIPALRTRRKDYFLIAADTSLPCLLNNGISPDAVLSIDCQHISYYHFMNGLPDTVPLFLDLASPPLLSSISKKHVFFSCGNPLTRYISRLCGCLPELDSSGGNVTYAAVSLAELLGAEEIELYGADYSYPNGISYAKGTYLYSYFDKKSNRFSPTEAQASAFLFRTQLEKVKQGNFWYYQTKTLNFYREKLEEKSAFLDAALIPVKGFGAPIKINFSEKHPDGSKGKKHLHKTLGDKNEFKLAHREFLSGYRNAIQNLPKAEDNGTAYFASLSEENKKVFITLLPVAAAIKHRNPHMSFMQLLEEVKAYCYEQTS